MTLHPSFEEAVEKHPYRVLFCNNCKWTYAENACGVAMVNQCPSCGKYGLEFVQSNELETIKLFCEKKELAPEWLRDAKRILVCGRRTYAGDVAPVLSKHKFALCITGGALGADLLAHIWARSQGIQTLVYKAEWKRYGKSAGFIRNTQMLKEGRPDLVIAFPGGPGTAMMCRIAEQAGVEVYRV